MTAYFMIFITLIISYANAQIIDCDALGTCPYNSFDCDMVNNVDCIIQCLNSGSCEGTTFNGGVGKIEINCGANGCSYAYFNGGDGDMIINCAQQFACSGTTWNGGNGNLIAVCSGSSACDESYQNCPPGKYCNITCSGSNACGPGIIRTGDGNTIMNIFASGEDALEYVNIYCPQNSIRGGTTNSCNIYGYNTPGAFIMPGLKIYTVEGYHDVNMICDNGNDGCFNDLFDSSTRARLYCAPVGNIWTTYCPLTWDANDINMKCYKPPSASPTPHVCEDYLLPTEIPTVQPTAAPITTEPTTNPTISPSDNPSFSPTSPTDVPTKTPTDHSFCTDNGNVGNGLFMRNNDAYSGQQNEYEKLCELCVCNEGKTSAICDSILTWIPNFTDDEKKTFMETCELEDECSFNQVVVKQPEETVKECGCEIFECVPLTHDTNNGNAIVIGLLIYVAIVNVVFVQ